MKGENSSNWKGGKIEITCKFCGRKRIIPPSYASYVSNVNLKKKEFVCSSCIGKTHLGENNPNFRDKVKLGFVNNAVKNSNFGKA